MRSRVGVGPHCSTSICDLGDPRVRLRHPLTVLLQMLEDEVIASWPEVEAWASASTDIEAINDLKDEIVRLYFDLARSRDGSLGKLPLRWKRSLEAAIEKRR